VTIAFHELWETYNTYLMAGFNGDYGAYDNYITALPAYQLLDELARYEKNVHPYVQGEES